MTTTSPQEKAPKQIHKYQLMLQPEDLDDPAKFKIKILSVPDVLDAAAVVAQASFVPGLPAAVQLISAVFNRVDEGRICRMKCKMLMLETRNLLVIVAYNEEKHISDRIKDMIEEFHKRATHIETHINNFLQLGGWQTFLRYRWFNDRLEEYKAALDMFRKDYVLAYRLTFHENYPNQQQKMFRSLKMDPSIDPAAPDLPMDLSREITITDPTPIEGSRYIIQKGKWVGHDTVALKFPRNFEALKCDDACPGTEATCSNLTRHKPAQEAMRIRDVACGLEYMHKENVVHASLNPGNILINPGGTACIGDFSKAKIVNDNYGTRSDPGEETAFMRYQAPEEQLLPRLMRKAGDVFAWSSVSLEILSEVKPYPEADGPSAIGGRIFHFKIPSKREEHPTPLWEKHPGLWDLIESCRQEEPVPERGSPSLEPRRPAIETILPKLDEYIRHEEANSQ
ncbi:hypothetical protein FRB90_005348 [Tulasnella sp. 427]|nr:hypothetical protein FRB90_005348 [Tulasnella sp. 427]